jgi:hypothetical protein
MSLRHLWRRWLRQQRTGRRPSRRPALESLEERCTPTNYRAGTTAQLIKEINAANAAGGTNAITLTRPPTSPYVLSTVNNSTDGPTALPVIAAGDTLTILSRGDTIERSASAPAMRLFEVAGGATLTLTGLTLEGGLAFGSGVAAEGGTRNRAPAGKSGTSVPA